MLRALLSFGKSRRVPRSGLKQLTSKRGPRNFYKGKGAESTGVHTRKGGFVIQKEKLPEYVVPDLTGFTLKPYVSFDAFKSSVKEK